MKKESSERHRDKDAMHIICMVKFVPDIDGFSYDYEQNKLQRDNVRMILNPDDACAIAFALRVKERNPAASIEVITMAPLSVEPHMRDLLRLHIDAGTIITDPAFAGSDTYATSTILAKFLEGKSYDCILSGTRSLDGATSHIPAQVAESLEIDQMQDVTSVDIEQFNREWAVFQVEDETNICTYEMAMPGIIGLTRDSGYKLPYIAYEDFSRDVSSKLSLVSNQELQCPVLNIGSAGSLTQVVETFTKRQQKRNRKIVHSDKNGIEFVYTFLQKRGYV